MQTNNSAAEITAIRTLLDATGTRQTNLLPVIPTTTGLFIHMPPEKEHVKSHSKGVLISQ